MKGIVSLAWHTWIEAVRDRVLYLLLFFGLFVFLASQILAPLALGEGRRITIDIGLVSLSFFGCLLAIFVGHQLIFREIERKTLYFVFARPVRRSAFILGKYLGLLLTLGCATAAMGALLAAVLWLRGYAFGFGLLEAIGLVFLELAVVAALAVLLASFTSPILAGLFTLAAYVIGHGSGDLLAILAQSGPQSAHLAGFMRWIVPRLDLYHDSWPVLSMAGYSADQLAWAAGYAGLYAAACLVLAAIVLERRELAV